MTRTVGTLVNVTRGDGHKVVFVVLFSDESNCSEVARRVISELQKISENYPKQLLAAWPENTTSAREETWNEFVSLPWPQQIAELVSQEDKPIIVAFEGAFQTLDPRQHGYWFGFPARLRKKELGQLFDGLRTALTHPEPLRYLRAAKLRGGTPPLPDWATATDERHNVTAKSRPMGRPQLQAVIPEARIAVQDAKQALTDMGATISRGSIARHIAESLRAKGQIFTDRGVENFLRGNDAFTDLA